jgi:hypothetical protein
MFLEESTMKRAPIFLAALALGAAATIGISTAVTGGDPSPGRSGARVFEQNGSAAVSGVTLRLRSATFSGTETLLEVTASRDGVQLSAGEFRIPAGSVEVDSILARGGAMPAGSSPDSTFLELPPITRPGNASVTIASMTVGRFGTSDWRQLVGPWVVPLVGPASSEFPALMRTESFRSVTIEVAGTAILVNATRSSSRTIVEYTTPAGLVELSPPRLASGGKSPVVPFQHGDVGTVRRASYPTSKFGTPIALEFGPYSQFEAVGNSVVVNLGDVLRRIGTGRMTPGEIALLPTDTLSGNGAIPTAFEVVNSVVQVGGSPIDFGRRTPSGSVEVLRFRVAGTFERIDDPTESSPYKGTPSILDAKEIPMRMLTMESHFTKDGAGSVREGETTMEFYLEEGMDISTVTLVLGQAQRVVSGDWRATLIPLP